MALGLYYHDLFAKHLEGVDHVESPGRYLSIIRALERSTIRHSVEMIEARPAKRSWIEAIHDPAYVRTILDLKPDLPMVLDAGDTIATSATIQAALHAAGAGVRAVNDVIDGKFSAAFCAVRPPGHHAEYDRAMGFCLFNNIAIAAQYLIDKGSIHRVAIIDWDVHHGNGTENAFLRSSQVYYISLHQYPHYPGTGHANHRGTGEGEGFNLNIPMSVGDGDEEYLRAFTTQVVPALETFRPQFVLISAGFDAHLSDPLSGTRVSSTGFAAMTESLLKLAKQHCSGRIVSFLEGGYDVAALAESVEGHLKALLVE